jgi:hypothetical protein
VRETSGDQSMSTENCFCASSRACVRDFPRMEVEKELNAAEGPTFCLTAGVSSEMNGCTFRECD